MILEDSRDWYRALAEDIPVLITRVSAEGIVTYVNEASSGLIGMPRQDIIGTDFFQLAPPDYREQIREAFTLLTPEKPIVVFEHRNRGRLFRWKNRAVFSADGALKEYFTVGVDITDYRQAENKLRESEQRNRALVEAMPDLIFRYSSKGVYLDAEVKDFERLTEKGRKLYEAGRLIGANLYDAVPAELADMVMKAIGRVVETGKAEVVEYNYLVSGEPRHHEARIIKSGPYEVMSIVRDITDRKMAEQALRDSEERYREILATIEEGYYEVDLAGRITFCNDSTCRLFGGYSREEFIGISYKKLYRYPDEAFRNFNHVYTTGKPERGLVVEMIRKDGSIAFGEFSISLVRNKQGEVTGFKGIGRDVTERIEYERQLKYLSLYDQLTGIFNRAWFEAELDRLDKSREYPITIVSADLDGLKLINDTLGHNAGDKLLVACANLLKNSVRSSDILARVGGDEFSAILPRTDQATGESVVRRMRETVNTYNENNEGLPLGLSLGLAAADQSDFSLKDLFKQADDMMYRDKLYRSSSSRGKIVQSLIAALSERDYITEGHASRLEGLCRAIGEKVNLGSQQLSNLALLAQVHDLGKVCVPDHILFKPDPLTEDEWQVMRTHPEKGYRIANSSPDLAGIADYILKHHERWDGSGYPLGLKGTEIPVECRILAIIDAYDAMTGTRLYNKKKTAEEAVQEIKKQSGSHFDPDLVPVFLDVLSEVSE